MAHVRLFGPTWSPTVVKCQRICAGIKQNTQNRTKKRKNVHRKRRQLNFYSWFWVAQHWHKGIHPKCWSMRATHAHARAERTCKRTVAGSPYVILCSRCGANILIFHTHEHTLSHKRTHAHWYAPNVARLLTITSTSTKLVNENFMCIFWQCYESKREKSIEIHIWLIWTLDK